MGAVLSVDHNGVVCRWSGGHTRARERQPTAKPLTARRRRCDRDTIWRLWPFPDSHGHAPPHTHTRDSFAAPVTGKAVASANFGRIFGVAEESIVVDLRLRYPARSVAPRPANSCRRSAAPPPPLSPHHKTPPDDLRSAGFPLFTKSDNVARTPTTTTTTTTTTTPSSRRCTDTRRPSSLVPPRNAMRLFFSIQKNRKRRTNRLNYYNNIPR